MKNKNKKKKIKYSTAESPRESNGSSMSVSDLFAIRRRSPSLSIKSLKQTASKYKKKMLYKRKIRLQRKIKSKELELRRLKDVEKSINSSGYGSTDNNDYTSATEDTISLKVNAGSSPESVTPVPSEDNSIWLMRALNANVNENIHVITAVNAKRKKSIKIIAPENKRPNSFIKLINNDITCCHRICAKMYYFFSHEAETNVEPNDILDIDNTTDENLNKSMSIDKYII